MNDENRNKKILKVGISNQFFVCYDNKVKNQRAFVKQTEQNLPNKKGMNIIKESSDNGYSALNTYNRKWTRENYPEGSFKMQISFPNGILYLKIIIAFERCCSRFNLAFITFQQYPRIYEQARKVNTTRSYTLWKNLNRKLRNIKLPKLRSS